MKKFIFTLSAAICSFALMANEQSDAILKLLNSRAAGSPVDYAAAAEIVAKDAEAGKPLQEFLIAVISRDANAPKAARVTPEVREKYFADSRPKLVELANRRSNAVAMYVLSLEKNDLTLLKRAADGDNVQALNAWGSITLTQAFRTGVDTNDLENVMRRSYSCFRRAAELKDANGFYNLGMCLMEGYGCDVDREAALMNFKAAAEMHHPEAINNIGGFYRDGIVVEKDPVIAARWFAKSADYGNAYGELNYALALQRGEGVERDAEKAAKLFKESSAQGNAEAMNAYGMCLMNGDGVEKDELLAARWYEASAKRGYAPAMDNLAVCHELGKAGFKKDYVEGTVWKMRARAARGDRNAASWLIQNGHTLR